MNAWILLAIFGSFYVLLTVFAIGVHVGERHEAKIRARIALRRSIFNAHTDRAIDLVGDPL